MNMKKLFVVTAVAIVLIIGVVSIYPKDAEKKEESLIAVGFPKTYSFDDYDAKRTVYENSILAPEFTTEPEQILSIINTVYFYDEWGIKFDETNTVQDDFFLADGSPNKSDFMNTVYSSAGFVKVQGFTRSSLGLKNGGRMVVILPDNGISTGELLSTPDKMKTTFEGGEENSGEVVWEIPKFSFGSKLDVKDVLNSFGINSAFNETACFLLGFATILTQNRSAPSFLLALIGVGDRAARSKYAEAYLKDTI